MRRRYSTDDTIEAAVRWLLKNGWHLKNSKRHVRLESEDGKTHLTVSTSPCQQYAGVMFLRNLRHIGIDLRGIV
jgi:hypothetical protein